MNENSHIIAGFFGDIITGKPVVASDAFLFLPVEHLSWPRVLQAFSEGFRNRRISIADLEKAMGSGPCLTKLLQRIDPSIPPITTIYDISRIHN